jgi:hypothetical protein
MWTVCHVQDDSHIATSFCACHLRHQSCTQLKFYLTGVVILANKPSGISFSCRQHLAICLPINIISCRQSGEQCTPKIHFLSPAGGSISFFRQSGEISPLFRALTTSRGKVGCQVTPVGHVIEGVMHRWGLTVDVCVTRGTITDGMLCTYTITHACTHTLRLRLPAFCSVLQTLKQKPHTCVFPSHMVVIVYATSKDVTHAM